MDNTTEAEAPNAALINSFCEITSSSKEEAIFFLESHQWNLDSAVSTFLDDDNDNTNTNSNNSINNNIDPVSAPSTRPSNSLSSSPSPESHSPNYSPSLSPSRSRSPSPSPAAPYRLRSRRKKPAKSAASAGGSKTRRGGVRTLADLNHAPDARSASDDDDDDYEPEEYYTGGQKSGMLVQDPTKPYDADAIFDQARHLGVERPVDNLHSSSSSRSFTGTGRLLSGETVPSAPQPSQAVNHNVTFWRNGFTVNDGPLRRFDDPSNAAFLESIKKSECPFELQPADGRSQVHLDLMRREENYYEPKKRQTSFQGVGRTLGSSSGTATDPASPTVSLKTPPLPSVGLVVDSSLPTTSIQLRLADGTRMVSRFNLHHTIRDIRDFIEASRPGGERNYQLQTMGFPPKQLIDPEQTIEAAGIANSVVIQKF
ncbi:UBX domain-containing protein, putative [Ricinus communis]|uniref:UBX domain-containing protein, putative n=1 Tax=Ricinus communis TaxID=3988 RepID=B9SH50_RICCO|nr:UBX domain-containing protein, putative [Ricinus communis]|eukprot:XP_002525319.1 plant UBX domain-containing protein 4 [Ricinus communis]